jgi:hypothetical protein
LNLKVYVLGPLLFLTFINDLPAAVSSQTRLFADDCILYRPIRHFSDCETLQNDLDKLAQWEQQWGMQFHTSKCNSISVTPIHFKMVSLMTSAYRFIFSSYATGEAELWLPQMEHVVIITLLHCALFILALLKNRI